MWARRALRRICKIAHNVMLGVVIENLIEITLLAKQDGRAAPRLPAFMNNSAMGSMFTRYKSPALVNLDWTTTFTPSSSQGHGPRAWARREWGRADAGDGGRAEVLQNHFGAATLQKNPDDYLRRTSPP